MEHLAVVIFTPLLTFLFNYIFYRFIRTDVEQKIHQNNISYSGVFQEKIKIYKELLEKTYDLRILVNLYYVGEKKEDNKNTALLLHEFMRIYHTNRPFISDSLFQDFKKLKKAYMLLYQLQYKHLADEENKIDLNKIMKEFDSDSLERLEIKIVREIKEDLKTHQKHTVK